MIRQSNKNRPIISNDAISELEKFAKHHQGDRNGIACDIKLVINLIKLQNQSNSTIARHYEEIKTAAISRLKDIVNNKNINHYGGFALAGIILCQATEKNPNLLSEITGTTDDYIISGLAEMQKNRAIEIQQQIKLLEKLGPDLHNERIYALKQLEKKLSYIYSIFSVPNKKTLKEDYNIGISDMSSANKKNQSLKKLNDIVPQKFKTRLDLTYGEKEELDMIKRQSDRFDELMNITNPIHTEESARKVIKKEFTNKLSSSKSRSTRLKP